MLKRLELQGFKSFAEKTVLEFPQGISAIVGPNGSGKSNIVDAIRWVLGEQSLKNIRLGKSEDVIFSGTPTKPPAGFASVQLIFDNSKRLFPEELSEIAVGRKLYKDGESNYLLNQQEVRLKDIVRLMAAAKLGTKGLSIVTQGSGDAFLAASPQERREMLEEVLGLKEYRLKKEEASRKIEETKSNLDKIAALIEEILPHLRSLKRQVSRWEKRKEKAEELRELEEKYFHWRLSQIETAAYVIRDGKALEQEIEQIKLDIQDLEIKRGILEEELKKLQDVVEVKRQELEKIIASRQEAFHILGNIEGRIEVFFANTARIFPNSDKLNELVEKIKLEISKIIEKDDWQYAKIVLKSLVKEIDEFYKNARDSSIEDQLSDLSSRRKEILKKIEELEEQFRTINQSIEEKRLQKEKVETQMRKILQELTEKQKAIVEKNRVLQEYKIESEKRRLQEEDLAIRIREAGIDYEQFLKKYSNLPPPADIIPSEIESRILRLRRELADIGAIDETLLDEYKNTQSRYSFLTEQKADLEKALHDLEILQKELEKKINQEFSVAIDRINTEFQHYFRLLFSGGRARISEYKPKLKKLKTEEAKILEGKEDEIAIQEFPEPESEGIIVDVDIPRKRIKSLDMLSGGERALTAIALIFAIVGVSSPPFLVLDEIDAALDEANSERFAKLLNELSGRTQFILITHNRVTMEAADVLYGVVMQDGISKIFSLKLTEAEKLAAEDIHHASPPHNFRNIVENYGV